MLSVIFDMDGTLLDTQRICITAWNHAGSLQKVENVGNHIKHVCGMNEAGWTAYLSEHFPSLDMELFKREATEYIIKNGKITYKKGAKKLLGYLKEKGIKTALASGSSSEVIAYNLNKLNGLEQFDVIVGGEEVQNGKPAPDIFLLAAKRLGRKPQECFVIEDSKNGILSGSCAGMKCIGIPDVAEFDEEAKSLMVAELSSLDEVISIIEKEL